MNDLRSDLIRYFDNAFPRVQQDRWPFTITDLADGIMATINGYFPASAVPEPTDRDRCAQVCNIPRSQHQTEEHPWKGVAR